MVWVIIRSDYSLAPVGHQYNKYLVSTLDTDGLVL